MLIYIARSFPPSIGGIQRFNAKLSHNLNRLTPVILIKWGGGQWILPVFIPYAFAVSVFHCLTKPVAHIYVGDALMSPLGCILKWLTRKPVYANVHGKDIAFNFKPYQAVIPRCLKKLTKVICVSHDLKKECLNRLVPERVLHVIPNGVDVDEFDRTKQYELHVKQIEQQIGKNFDGKQVLITVGRLVPKKGIHMFLEKILPKILKRNPSVIYLIAGDGPLNSKIKGIIEENNLQDNAFLLGKVSMSSGLLPDLYQMADIFVMPNIPVKDDKEGFGIVALEAGAAKLTVVASNVDGIPEAVKEGENGFLIDHSDHDGFAHKILELLDNPDKLAACGQKARDFVKKNYAWPVIAQRYLSQFS